MIVELRKMIQDFINQGNKPEDCILAMHFGFYNQFKESIKKTYDLEVADIKKFMEFEIRVSPHVPENQCFAINNKIVMENARNSYPYTSALPIEDKKDFELRFIDPKSTDIF